MELQQKTIEMEEQNMKAEKELQSVHADYKAKVGLTFWIYLQARCPLR